MMLDIVNKREGKMEYIYFYNADGAGFTILGGSGKEAKDAHVTKLTYRVVK